MADCKALVLILCKHEFLKAIFRFGWYMYHKRSQLLLLKSVIPELTGMFTKTTEAAHNSCAGSLSQDWDVMDESVLLVRRAPAKQAIDWQVLRWRRAPAVYVRVILHMRTSTL